MEWDKLKAVCLEFIRKYRYAFLILLAGLILLSFPESKPSEKSSLQAESPSSPPEDLQTQLTKLLSRVQGAGKVQVLLTQASGEEVRYQSDTDQETEETGRKIRQETVLITDSSRAQKGLIARVDPPVYLGAVILCQGADSASVRLSLVEAVKCATGLSADRITVLKMK